MNTTYVHQPEENDLMAHNVEHPNIAARSHTATKPDNKPGASSDSSSKQPSSSLPVKDVKHKRFCVYCQTQKIWIFRGDKAKDGSKIYTDAQGSRWAGKRCPDCEKKRVKAANRHDFFERTSICKTLIAHGFKIISTSTPIIVEKHGEYSTVSIQRAFAENGGKIVIEKPTESADHTDYVALLFQTTKIIPKEQLKSLAGRIEVFTKDFHGDLSEMVPAKPQGPHSYP